MTEAARLRPAGEQVLNTVGLRPRGAEPRDWAATRVRVVAETEARWQQLATTMQVAIDTARLCRRRVAEGLALSGEGMAPPPASAPPPEPAPSAAGAFAPVLNALQDGSPAAGGPDDRRLTLDGRRLTVQVDGRSSRLTPTEWQLLVALVRAEGEVLSRTELASRAWGAAFREQEVEVYVCRLRRKLALLGARDGIQTVRGVGYRASTVS